MYASNRFWTHFNSRQKTAGKSQAENLRRVRLKICNDRKKPLWNWRFFSCFYILRPLLWHFRQIFGCIAPFFLCTSILRAFSAVFWTFFTVFTPLRPLSCYSWQVFGCFCAIFPLYIHFQWHLPCILDVKLHKQGKSSKIPPIKRPYKCSLACLTGIDFTETSFF